MNISTFVYIYLVKLKKRFDISISEMYTYFRTQGVRQIVDKEI